MGEINELLKVYIAPAPLLSLPVQIFPDLHIQNHDTDLKYAYVLVK